MGTCIDGRQGGTTATVVALAPFKRFHTLGTSRRRFAIQILSKRPQSTILFEEKCDQHGAGGIDGNGTTEGPATWSTSFEKLLEDVVGLHAFAEFLKKEFSAENIYFWTACERYRRLKSHQERIAEAERIFRQHLGTGAPEAVNVDAQGRQTAEQGLVEGRPDLFDIAQKQIFNLMKFDSYPRFLKCQLYKQCLAGQGYTPKFDIRLSIQNPVYAISNTPSKLKKSLSNAEDRRGKSLLPWNRKNSNQRSKSRDRNNELASVQKSWDGVLSVPSNEDSKRFLSAEIHSSHSSLTSLDLASNQDLFKADSSSDSRTLLCRVLLSNGSTTVVQIKENETISQLVSRLLEKRGLSYSSFEVLTNKHPKPLDIAENSTQLAGCEVTVEQRVVFKLDLPNKKIISVKSKYTKNIVDVLRPILHKYKFSLEDVTVSKAGYPVDINLSVTTIDNARLNIQLKDGCEGSANQSVKTNNMKISKLDEITNKVFEGILQEKSDEGVFKPPRSDRGSVKSEDWGSEHSSGLFGKFLRRDSAVHEKKKKPVASSRVKTTEIEDTSGEGCQKKPLIAKLKAGANKLHVGASSESDELVEGLTRAQRRLEDQRGTEINFELPDFLKDKEDDRTNSSNPGPQDPQTKANHARNPKQNDQSHNYENQNVKIPAKTSPVKRQSPVKSAKVEGDSGAPKSDPPPLPPKPKIVPIKPPNWGQSGFYKAKDVPLGKHSEMFLEQPSSSFV